MSSYQVKYKEILENGISQDVVNVCFSRIYGGCYGEPTVNTKPTQISYNCPVYNVLTDLEMNNWITFMGLIFDPTRYTVQVLFEACKHLEQKVTRQIAWVLNTKGFSRIKALTYLTAMRYPDEYEGIVKEVSKLMEAKIPLDELFIKFQEFHILIQTGKLASRQQLGGHSLMCHYHATPYELIISLDEFKTNLNEDKKKTVYSFFQETPSGVKSKFAPEAPAVPLPDLPKPVVNGWSYIPPIVVAAAPIAPKFAPVAAPVVPKPIEREARPAYWSKASVLTRRVGVDIGKARIIPKTKKIVKKKLDFNAKNYYF